MSLIQKTALRLLKWGLENTLFRSPQGDPESPLWCLYCPELCRFSCPVAVGTGNDALTPRFKHTLGVRKEHWSHELSAHAFPWPIYGCTGCGRCTQFCVYEVPVGEHLFLWRKQQPWGKAQQLAKTLVSEDPVGDLAFELGAWKLSQKRLRSFIEKNQAPYLVKEPKELFFLKQNGYEAKLLWETVFDAVLNETDLGKKYIRNLQEFFYQKGGTRWLLVESPWWNLRLVQAKKWCEWVRVLKNLGMPWVLAFECGAEALENGGEGAYQYLFAQEAAQMAQDLIAPYEGKIDGVLCFSARAKTHLKKSVGSLASLAVYALEEVLRGRMT